MGENQEEKTYLKYLDYQSFKKDYKNNELFSNNIN
jgi:hypothetical protein